MYRVMVVEHFVDRHRLMLALYHHGVDFRARDRFRVAYSRCSRSSDACRVQLARAFQARSQVNSVTDDGVIHASREPMLPETTVSVLSRCRSPQALLGRIRVAFHCFKA